VRRRGGGAADGRGRGTLAAGEGAAAKQKNGANSKRMMAAMMQGVQDAAANWDPANRRANN
jgi:hypothetical protein